MNERQISDLLLCELPELVWDDTDESDLNDLAFLAWIAAISDHRNGRRSTRALLKSVTDKARQLGATTLPHLLAEEVWEAEWPALECSVPYADVRYRVSIAGTPLWRLLASQMTYLT